MHKIWSSCDWKAFRFRVGLNSINKKAVRMRHVCQIGDLDRVHHLFTPLQSYEIRVTLSPRTTKTWKNTVKSELRREDEKKKTSVRHRGTCKDGTNQNLQLPKENYATGARRKRIKIKKGNPWIYFWFFFSFKMPFFWKIFLRKCKTETDGLDERKIRIEIPLFEVFDRRRRAKRFDVAEVEWSGEFTNPCGP